MEKILHFMWWQGLSSAPSELQDVPRKWQEMNPEYQVKVWDEVAILTFIGRVYPKYFRFFCDIGLGQDKKISIIKKCDFSRLLILHAFGGGYIDLDCIPLKPIRSLWEGAQVEHTFTNFKYSRNSSFPSTLKDTEAFPIATDFSRYELILSREHCPNASLGGYPIANTVMWGKAGAPLLVDLIQNTLRNVNEKVLAFAGPLAISRYLKASAKQLEGRVITLPPYYFLWQVHDMGQPWKKSVCHHLNKMDWADKTRHIPWDC